MPLDSNEGREPDRTPSEPAAPPPAPPPPGTITVEELLERYHFRGEQLKEAALRTADLAFEIKRSRDKIAQLEKAVEDLVQQVADAPAKQPAGAVPGGAPAGEAG